jgi:hypothetical protein
MTAADTIQATRDLIARYKGALASQSNPPINLSWTPPTRPRSEGNPLKLRQLNASIGVAR